MNKITVVGLILICITFPPRISASDAVDAVNEITQPFTGDLPEMHAHHVIRVLVIHSQTNFFFVKGEPHGFDYELMQQYGRFLNKSLSRRKIPTRILYIPVPFDQLISGLLEGRGDIAAAGLTITKNRQQQVAFTTPYLPQVEEIIITRRGLKTLTTLEDLSKNDVYHIKGGSYGTHLKQLNARFRSSGFKPIHIVEASENLATEDLLELTNAGVINYMVADRQVAELWSGVLDNIVLRPDLTIHRGGYLAWAVRKNNPKLLHSLNSFIRTHKKGTLVGNVLFQRYYKDRKWISNPLEKKERRKLDRFIWLFKKYGEQYGFDWLALAAQAYEESGFNQQLKSHRGAIGIMQILPETAASQAVNISDIDQIDNNIHAGVKYLAYLRDTYFSGSALSPEERIYFSFAAYNAGPTRVQRLRRRAESMGVSPNKWFFNVELAALKYVGREPVRYVANIYKYYIAYKLIFDSQKKKQEEKEALQP